VYLAAVRHGDSHIAGLVVAGERLRGPVEATSTTRIDPLLDGLRVVTASDRVVPLGPLPHEAAAARARDVVRELEIRLSMEQHALKDAARGLGAGRIGAVALAVAGAGLIAAGAMHDAE
jgi:hypothetical protein